MRPFKRWRGAWKQHVKRMIGARRVADLPSNYVLWAGPSRLDGTPIMVVATCAGDSESANGKTGDMVQIAIMRQDMSPGDTYNTGNDGAICPGDCDHISIPRGGLGTCYVNKGRLRKSWETAFARLSAGNVGHPPGLFTGARVRFGMDGDPSAVPLHVWLQIAGECDRWTGYTANWRHLDSAWASLFMASVQSPADALRARSMGWRVFMSSMDPKHDAPETLTECRADSHDLPCVACALCDGNAGGSKRPDIWLRAHGTLGSKHRKSQA